jgi:holliday junction DNA helicase RuvA
LDARRQRNQMLATIRGPVITSGDGYLVIEASGLGFKVRVPEKVIREISIDDSILLNTELIIRQDIITLYGFLTFEEAELFRMLISVSHIGPQTGLAIINTLSIEEIFTSITTKNPETLTKVSGLGKKGAERIILELNNKIKSLANLGLLKKTDMSSVQDAILALVSLGYRQDESERACIKVHSDNSSFSSADIIRESLRILKNK